MKADGMPSVNFSGENGPSSLPWSLSTSVNALTTTKKKKKNYAASRLACNIVVFDKGSGKPPVNFAVTVSSYPFYSFYPFSSLA